MGHCATDARKGMTPMRRTLIVVLSVAVLSCAATLGGCVSAAEHSRVQAANRRVNDRVTQLVSNARADNAQIKSLRGQKERLQEELATRMNEAKAAKSAYDAMKARYDEIQALYRTEMERDSAPGMGPLPAKVHAALRALAAANPDLMEYLPKYGMVKMKSDLSFALGSADVKQGASAALGRLAMILKSPAAAKLHVYIAGHTDDVPIRAAVRKHPTNWYLSAHRAIGVQKVLVRAGLDPVRIGVMGFGEYHPVVPNKPGHKGNPANRRVEIWIIPPGRLLTLPALSE